MDPVNVITYGKFIEQSAEGEIYSLDGAEYLVFEDYSPGFGLQYSAKLIR